MLQAPVLLKLLVVVTQKASSQPFTGTSSLQDTGQVYQPTDDVTEIQQGLPVKQNHPYWTGAYLFSTGCHTEVVQQLPVLSGPVMYSRASSHRLQFFAGYRVLLVTAKSIFPPLLARRGQLQLNRSSNDSRVTSYRGLLVAAIF